jgi:hypothetical protein
LKIFQLNGGKSMVIGITMIKTTPGQEKASFDALRETEGVKKIYNLFGEFDFFLILEALDRGRLNQLLEEIHNHRYVLDIWPLLVSKEESLPDVKMAFSLGREMAVS